VQGARYDRGAVARIDPAARVCRECGELVGAEPFCASCGVNLRVQERVPTRSEWEERQEKAVSGAENDPPLQEVRLCSDCLAPVATDHKGRCPSCGILLFGDAYRRVRVADPTDPNELRRAVQEQSQARVDAGGVAVQRALVGRPERCSRSWRLLSCSSSC
jgi:uncharacterized paraquat-inducible protein A